MWTLKAADTGLAPLRIFASLRETRSLKSDFAQRRKDLQRRQA